MMNETYNFVDLSESLAPCAICHLPNGPHIYDNIFGNLYSIYWVNLLSSKNKFISRFSNGPPQSCSPNLRMII